MLVSLLERANEQMSIDYPSVATKRRRRRGDSVIVLAENDKNQVETDIVTIKANSGFSLLLPRSYRALIC